MFGVRMQSELRSPRDSYLQASIKRSLQHRSELAIPQKTNKRRFQNALSSSPVMLPE
jgi:hypothetical protein